MDKIDKKIMKELIENSRIPLSKLGKNVRLSRENVHYRIQNLSKKNLIRDFVTSINYSKLGFLHNTIFIQLDKIDNEKEKIILNYLKKQNRVSWIGILSGSWSLTFDVYSKSINELNDFISKFLNKFNKNIGRYIVLGLQESEYFFNKIIDEKVNIKFNENINKHKIDKIDLSILNELNVNSRISYVDIADRLKLTPNAIKNRLKNLEKSSIINSYSISINHKEFGLEWNGLQIKVKRPSTEFENNLKNYFRNHPKVIFYYHYNKSGIYDFDLGVIVRNSQELRDFINDLRSRFYDEISINDTFLVLDEVSSHKLPDIIFKK